MMERWARKDVVDGERVEVPMRAAQWKEIGEKMGIGKSGVAYT